jgi:mannose-1-phosphate guanylyltransferase / mannose-6-phosphate isomerase
LLNPGGRMGEIQPVILCGGLGRRLWPLSTPSRPKPFHALTSAQSLYQETIGRVQGLGFAPRPVVVTEASHEALAREQAAAIGVVPHFVLEPQARDSCAAALAGILAAASISPASPVLILASDHHIPDRQAFAASVFKGCAAADAGRIVVFGVKPKHASSAYGYLICDDGACWEGTKNISRYVEKPPLAMAHDLMNEGAAWNSGNFLGLPRTWLAEAQASAGAILRNVEAAMLSAERATDGSLKLGAEFLQCAPISLDHAIMERAKQLSMVEIDHEWSDVGTWDEVARLVGDGPSFIDAPDIEVRAPGCEDLIIVFRDGKLLVTRRGMSASLKDTSVLPYDQKKGGERAPKTPHQNR